MRRCLPVLSLFMLMACHDKVICPAFQSTYILDDSTRFAFHSYVWQLEEATRSQFLSTTTDSLGQATQPETDYYAYAGDYVVPWRVHKRNKYGIAKYEPYWLKQYRMRTAPMEDVHGPELAETDFVASDFSSSLGVDSLALASDSLATIPVAMQENPKDAMRWLFKYDPKDDFNVEQVYYNKYFREKFIDKRPRSKPFPVDSLGHPIIPDSLRQKDPFFKRLFSDGWFKGMFKKKENKTDTTSSFIEGPLDKEPPQEELPVEETGNE